MEIAVCLRVVKVRVACELLQDGDAVAPCAIKESSCTSLVINSKYVLSFDVRCLFFSD